MLYDQITRGEIVAPAWVYFGRLTEADRTKLAEEIFELFEAWRTSKTSPNGTIDAWLGRDPDLPASLLNMRELQTVPASTLKHWQLGGQFDNNEIDVVFHLWAQKFLPFDRLLMRWGMASVFSVVTVLNYERADITSLARVAGLLTRFLAGEIEAVRTITAVEVAQKLGTKKPRRTREGALARGKGKTQKKLERSEKLRQTALEFMQSRPGRSRDQVVAEVHRQQMSWPGYRKSLGVVEKALGGVFGPPRPRKK